jgi:hypothetical protein
MDSAMAAKFGFLSVVPVSRNPEDFCSNLNEAERAIIEDNDFDWKIVLHEREKVTHQHCEPAVP